MSHEGPAPVDAPVDLDRDPAESDGSTPATPAPKALLPLVLGATAVVAVIRGQEPTGQGLADLLLTAAFAAAVPWFASNATVPRQPLLAIGAGLALFFSGFQAPSVIFAAIALVIAMAVLNEWSPLDASTSQALVGGFVVLAALELPSVRFVGSASLLAVIAVVPVVFAGYRSLADDQRRVVNRTALGIAAFAVIATVLAIVVALWARTGVEQGIDQAEAGIDALEAGDQPGAVVLLEEAQRNFDTAQSRLGSVLTWPARVVPVAAQHSRALEAAAGQGRNLAAAAVKTVTTADVEQIRGNNGAIDLTIVRSVANELGNANGVLRNAQAELRNVRSPWLLPLLDDRLASVEVELAEVLDDIDLANHATSVVPALLGGDGPRQYLVLFVQPAEAREYGGFVGAYGLLQADDGQLRLLESGSMGREFGDGEAEFASPGDYPESYYEKLPFRFPQNLTGTPDLGTIAEAVRELAPQWREDPGFTIDGVMTIDPFALAGFLELTGPVQIASRDEEIDATNVVDFLLREQYLEFEGDALDERQEALRELAGAAFANLLSIEIPGPERLGAIFGPLARGDRIAFTTFDDLENEFLRRILLDADLPNVSDEVEMVGWVQATGVAGKLDAYATRALNYSVTVDPATGATEGLLRVDVGNEAPLDAGTYVLGNVDRPGLDETTLTVGTNFVIGSLITRADVERFDSPDGPSEGSDPTPILSYDLRALAVEVPIGEQRSFEAELRGSVAPGRYDLLITHQAAATVGEYSVEIAATEGWRIVDDGNVDAAGTWRRSGALEHHQPISVVFERVG